MEETKYNVPLTEKEARVIGEIRWKKKHLRPLFGWVGGLVAASIAALAGFGLAGVTDWITVPVCMIFLIAAYIVFVRFVMRQDKAGKAFAQALKEGK